MRRKHDSLEISGSVKAPCPLRIARHGITSEPQSHVNARKARRQEIAVLSSAGKEVLERFAHDRRVHIDAGPISDADYTLIDDHAQAVEHAAAMTVTIDSNG
jgi:hypothetical protein